MIQKNINKEFTLKRLDSFLPEKIVVIRDVTNNKEAVEKAKKIVRKEYEKTNTKQVFDLLKDGKATRVIIMSPDCSDPGNLPICRFCYIEGKKSVARFVEDLSGAISYTCTRSRHRIRNKFLKSLSACIQVSIYDLWENKEIFSNKPI